MRDDDDLDLDLDPVLLGSLPAQLPPEGFADRVVTAWAAEASAPALEPRAPSRVRTRTVVATVVGAAAAALLLTVAQRWPMAPADGAHVATTRVELNVGERAVAVLEAGADVSWRVARGGDTVVEQRRGRAFYRVERGGDFVVRTPAGQARVTGTSFSLEVNEMTTEGIAGRKGALLAGATAGAAVTAALFLTVHEGSVVLTRGDAELEVRAGERAEVVGDAAPTKNAHASAFDRELLDAERRALREKVDDLEGRLKDVMIARSRGEDPLAVEARACEQRLAALERELDVEQQMRNELEGEPVPFPEDLDERYRQDALKSAFLDIFARAGLNGDVVGIDCNEYPCVVYGDYTVEGDARAHDEAARRFEELLHEHYPSAANGHSIRSSNHRDEASGVTKTTFGVSVLPKSLEPSDEEKKNLHRRLQHRNQQFFEATWGAR